MTDTTRTDSPRRLAVDIGGTFVDAIELDPATGVVRFRKASTTPEQPWVGVLNAIDALGVDLNRVEVFIHGTTLGLNAVLERRGGRTGIITNEGFRDIFLLGRGNVPSEAMYDFQYERPESLVQRRYTAGVIGRLDYRGRVVQELDPDSVRAAARSLIVDHGVRSIAISFLHSFMDPSHERQAAALIREDFPDVSLSLSTDIAREYREYERTSTTVVEAYIRPIFERYVDELEKGLISRGFGGQFLIMRSGGGSMTSATAKTAPTHTVLSGPAGGIVGACYLARELDRPKLLTIDIGGTSLDACVIENGAAVAAFESQLEHFPLLIPTYDIRTIGAGGGSIAWLDRGLLKVGPQSAGASPGPVCYGRGGTRPTVTDASVVLGFVDPTRFLGGQMGLAVDAAEHAIRTELAEPLGLSVTAAAAGVLDVLLAKTVGAVRQITVERGHDPQDFSLLAFGGAGPLLSPLLAQEMGIGEVVIPLTPSGFSAWGMLCADIVDDVSRTVMITLDRAATGAETVGGALDELERVFGEVGAEAAASLDAQGVDADRTVLERQLEMRYLGQEHSMLITVGSRLDAAVIRQAFEDLHRARYGHAMDNDLQILNVRVRAIGRSARPDLTTSPNGDGVADRARLSDREAYDLSARAMTTFAVYDRALLQPGDTFAGPALVDEGTSTTVVPGGQRVRVDPHGYLVITGEARP
jgi:N-methylhydantoinase A